MFAGAYLAHNHLAGDLIGCTPIEAKLHFSPQDMSATDLQLRLKALGSHRGRPGAIYLHRMPPSSCQESPLQRTFHSILLSPMLSCMQMVVCKGDVTQINAQAWHAAAQQTCRARAWPACCPGLLSSTLHRSLKKSRAWQASTGRLPANSCSSIQQLSLADSAWHGCCMFFVLCAD